MEPFYFLAGMIARACERGSRNRVNGIGLNWWILVGVIVLGCAAVAQIVEALNNRAPATPMPLAQVLAGESMVDRQVAVKGAFDPSAALSRKKKGGGDADPDEFWVPIVDEEAGKAIFVKINVKQVEGDNGAGDGHVRGMLRKMDSDLRSHVAKTAPQSAGIRIDDRYVIVASEKPATLWIWMAVATVAWLVALMMLLAVAFRYVVFRRTAAPPPQTPIAPGPGKMRASGVFCFNEKERKRFFDVPVMPAEMASSDPALISYVDASESFMGAKTRDLAGLWAIIMKRGTLSEAQYGRLYAGMRIRPALRVSFVDAITGRSARVIVSFDSEAEREGGRDLIYNPPPPPPPESPPAEPQPAQAPAMPS
jgi:hypothetical protein